MNEGRNHQERRNTQKRKKQLLILAAIILTCFCLRAPITGVGPMTGMIQEDLGLSAAGAGMLTTIPLIVFAALSVRISRIAEIRGMGNCLLVCMAVLAAGIIARSMLGAGGSYTAGIIGLYGGTVLIGIGITAGNVLIPGIVKEYFPLNVGVMTGIYATVMSAAGGISSGISVPIAEQAGWRKALMIWLALTVAAALIWIPARRREAGDKVSRREGAAVSRKREGSAGLVYPQARQPLGPSRRSVAKSPMAWAIVFYFGIQSLVFYSFAAWLPAIMQSKGFDPVTAGYFASVFIMIGIPATFLVPIFSQREGDECLLNVIIGLMFTLGMVLLIVSDHPAVLMVAAVSGGLAVGACFSQSMALFGLRTKDAHDAAALSGLAQSVGYLFAAMGPALAGWTFDAFGSWLPSLGFMTALAIAETIIGYIVGREMIIGEEE
ncbi:MAG: MFS transporter [Firmicutes bacterium]|nr:MFS transporter [Bacillota bacterium]